MMPNNHYLGVQINNYTITKELASGGFGSVFLAQHNKLNRMVAIKLLLAAHLGSQQQQDQFMQEALLLDKVKHPYVLPILDVGVYTTIPYIMMEYASGGSLRDRLNQHPAQPLPAQETLAILSQVGPALQHAHQQNIIHRDIKPENILFNDKGDALLADFGIAIALSTASMKYVTSMIGTPPYMAPEQFKGTVYKESDQYALGCVAYELLTGRIPFQAPDMISMAFLHATETPQSLVQLNATIPSYVEQAVLKAIAKQRNDRHADIYTFVRALQTPVQTPLQPANAAPAPPAPSPALPITVIAAAPKETKTLEEWLADGLTHLQAKRYKEALSAYEHAILLNPILAKAHIGRGDAFYGLKLYGEASRSYEEAIRLDPKDPTPHIGQGNVQKAQQNYLVAIQHYEQAISLDKQCVSAHSSIGDIRFIFYVFFSNQTKLDINVIKQIASYQDKLLEPIKPSDRQYGQYGQPTPRTPPDQYQLTLALDAYNKAMTIDPDFAPAHRGKGRVFTAQQRYSEALAELQQAIRLDPSLAEAYNDMGVALRELGMREAALVAFQQATQLDSTLVDASTYINIGVALRKLGKHEEAITAFQQATQLNSTLVDASTYYDIGIELYNLGKHEEALPAFLQATQLESNFANAYQALGSTLSQLGKTEEAQTAFQRAENIRITWRNVQAEPPRKKSFFDKLRDSFS